MIEEDVIKQLGRNSFWAAVQLTVIIIALVFVVKSVIY